jgi:hypothetical protein
MIKLIHGSTPIWFNISFKSGHHHKTIWTYWTFRTFRTFKKIYLIIVQLPFNWRSAIVQLPFNWRSFRMEINFWSCIHNIQDRLGVITTWSQIGRIRQEWPGD